MARWAATVSRKLRRRCLPAISCRGAVAGEHLPSALLLGRTWGQSSDSLKLEGRFAPACIARLRELGHDVEVLADFSEAMGHAGAIVRHPNGA
jgi:hypothetical protein